MKAPDLWLDRTILRSCYLALCTTEAEFRRLLERIEMPPPHPAFVSPGAAATTHHIDTSRGRACIVCMPGSKGYGEIDHLALLVHEAVHVWQETRDDIGEDRPGREIEAYAIQNIAQELMEAWRDRSKRKRR